MNGGSDPLDLNGSFQHPFVPQDLWQMPMTLEWDWADLTGYGGIDAAMHMGGLANTGVDGDAAMDHAPDNATGKSEGGTPGGEDGTTPTATSA